MSDDSGGTQIESAARGVSHINNNTDAADADENPLMPGRAAARSPVPGYHGCWLRIDLSRPDWTSIPLPEELLRRTIGGTGLGTELLLSEGAALADPLSPEASLAFVFSPLVGSPLTTSAKFAVVSRSPLTGRFNDSLASSGFAVAGKKTGYDAILITGRADQLSLLMVDDGRVSILPAAEYAGQDISETESRLQQQFGPEFEIAVIGPAGERLVRFATISHAGRHAGRGGSGAVLGSKNIKAILVRGTQRVRWADSEALVRYAKRLSEKSFGPATEKYRELGTASNLLVFNRLNVLPTRNFQDGHFAAAATLSPEQLSESRQRTRASCVACTIGCEHLYELQGASHPVRIEYENLFALGPLCGIQDPDTVLRASAMCDEAGIDTISAGGTIAFAMECAERGLLNEPWLRFGDGAALLHALKLIRSGEGIGTLLAGGSRFAAGVIGQSSIEFAPQVKGLELPGYDPRGLQMMGLGFAVGPRGADHNRSGAYEVDFSESADRRDPDPSRIQAVIETEDKAVLMDSLILCKFLRGVFDDFFEAAAEMLQMVTGWNLTPQELRNTAKQLINAKKQFNIRAGWSPAEDRLPERMLNRPMPSDSRACLTTERLAALIREYNLARGWDEQGWPLRSTAPNSPAADVD